MRLTVLGKYGPFPAPKGACSGYLIETDAAKILVDCGNGILSRLLEILHFTELDCVILSHLHSDHISDMFILRYALQQYKDGSKKKFSPLALIMPDEPEAEYKTLSNSGVFNISPISDGMKIKCKDISISFKLGVHPVPSYSVIMHADDKKLVYTGDTGFYPDLIDVCMDADIILADTCLLASDKSTEIAPHLTAKEAGELATASKAKRLLCTHIWANIHKDEDVIREAALYYPLSEVTQEFRTYII